MAQQFDPNRPYDVPVYRPEAGEFEIERGVNPADLAASRQLESDLLMRNRILIAEGESARLQQNMVRNLEAIKGLQEGILGVINERVKTSSSQELDAQNRLRIETEKRLDAEHEVDAVIQERGSRITDQLRAMKEINQGSMRVRIGRAPESLPEKEIQRLFSTPANQLNDLDQTRREAIRQRMIDREMAGGAIANARQESGIGETLRNLLAQQRSGRGLAAGELLSSLRGISLGPVGIGLAALQFLPQIMGSAERTWDSTIGLPLNQLQQSRRLGMITGGGAAEGFGMRRDAFVQGFNPFDLISRQVALEIQQGLAEQGFRGDLRAALADTVIGAVNDLGIEHSKAIELVAEAYRTSSMTLDQISGQLERFDDIAKATGRSINDVAEQMGALTTFARQGGSTGTDAGNLAQNLLTSFGRNWSAGTVQQVIGNENVLGYTASLMGVMPQDVLSQPLPQLTGALGESLDFWIRMAPGTDSGAKARWLNNPMSGSPFVGVGVPAIEEFIRRGGGGQLQSNVPLIEAQTLAETQTARNRRSRDRKTTSFSEFMGDVLSKGVFGDARKAAGWAGDHFWINEREARENVLAGIPPDQLIAQRQRILDIAAPSLSPQMLKEFQRNIGNPRFDLEAKLSALAGRTGEQVGDAVSIGGIKIELSDDSKRHFKLRGREAQAAGQGVIPWRSQYGTGQARTWDRG